MTDLQQNQLGPESAAPSKLVPDWALGELWWPGTEPNADNPTARLVGDPLNLPVPAHTELRELLSAPSMLRNCAIGGILAMTGALAPLATRWVYGVMSLTELISTLAMFAAVTVLAVAVMLITIRWSLQRRWSLRRASVFGVLAGIPVMVVSYAAALDVHLAFPHLGLLDPAEPQSLQYQIVTGISDALPIMAFWAGFIFVPAIVRAHEERQSELLAARREAELLRLRSHLEPHFVLNTMNAIGGLVTEDPEQARELLAMLGDLFRDASRFDESQTVAREVAWLQRFVAIHELRFGEKIQVTWDIEPATVHCSFPSLLLQPLVENALVHGALRRERGELSIRFCIQKTNEPGSALSRKDSSRVLIAEVRDNGPGIVSRRQGGKGLALVERRLALEPSAGKASPRLLLSREGDVTLARVELPILEVAARTP